MCRSTSVIERITADHVVQWAEQVKSRDMEQIVMDLLRGVENESYFMLFIRSRPSNQDALINEVLMQLTDPDWLNTARCVRRDNMNSLCHYLVRRVVVSNKIKKVKKKSKKPSTLGQIFTSRTPSEILPKQQQGFLFSTPVVMGRCVQDVECQEQCDLIELAMQEVRKCIDDVIRNTGQETLKKKPQKKQKNKKIDEDTTSIEEMRITFNQTNDDSSSQLGNENISQQGSNTQQLSKKQRKRIREKLRNGRTKEKKVGKEDVVKDDSPPEQQQHNSVSINIYI